jgi:hypothetical protein
MFTFEIICLAKSIKHRGACIAGLKTDGSGWLRPLSERENGTLFFQDYILDNGQDPKLFDIIRIQCIKPKVQYHQPENWIVNPRKMWQFVGHPTLEQARKLINPEVGKHYSFPKLLGDLDSKISDEYLRKIPIESSLALIKPNDIQWCLSTLPKKRNFRAVFYFSGIVYDLPITDLVWNSKLDQLDDGIYSSKQVIDKLEMEHFDPNKFFFTISLSEPYSSKSYNQQFCYKLVAAVFNSSDVKKRFNFS